MFAHLSAYDNISHESSVTSLEYNDRNPEDVIQLTIGAYNYIFDNTGKLLNTSIPPTCIDFTNNHIGTCASFPNPDRRFKY